MRLITLAFACLLAPGCAMAASPAPPLSADECAVWQREQSFAKSVANHDAAGICRTRRGERRLRCVLAATCPRPRGHRQALGRPDRRQADPAALVSDARHDGPGCGADVAWSSGPGLFEVLDPKAKDKYLLGAFHSVWHKDDDGVWRVLFDDGVEPRPATAAEVSAFHAGRADCSSQPQLTDR